MTAALYAPELLGIDVQHLPRRLVLVAHHRLGGLQGHTSATGQLGRAPGQRWSTTRPGPGRCEPASGACGAGPRWPAPCPVRWPAVNMQGGWRHRPGHRSLLPSSGPATCGRGRCDAISIGGSHGGQTSFDHVFAHPIRRRRVNRAFLWLFIWLGALEKTGGLAIPRLSNSTQMNTYNLLGLHT